MLLRFTRNVALNTKQGLATQTADFYRSLGLEVQEIAPDFHSLGPAKYACFVVAWDPEPSSASELCLQLETDDLEEVKARIESGQGEIVYFGDDPNSPGRRHLWFRDPVGTLINVVEATDGT